VGEPLAVVGVFFNEWMVTFSLLGFQWFPKFVTVSALFCNISWPIYACARGYGAGCEGYVKKVKKS
jgi:hypothetical protein